MKWILLMCFVCFGCTTMTLYDNYKAYGDDQHMIVVEAVEERPILKYYRYKVSIKGDNRYYIVDLVTNDQVEVGSRIKFDYVKK